MDGQVARLGFGGMFGHGKTVDRVDLDELSRAVYVFLDSGYNFFDNAFAYDAEEPARTGTGLVQPSCARGLRGFPEDHAVEDGARAGCALG